MKKINCEVIEDLLPLYVENMASPSSKELVEEHLAVCEVCKQKEAQMHQVLPLPTDTNIKSLSSIRKYLFRKKITAIALTILSTLFLTLLCIIHLNSPIIIPYEDIADSINIQLLEDGYVHISINDNLGGLIKTEDSITEDGINAKYITLYTTRLRQLQKLTAGSSEINVSNKSTQNPQEIVPRRIYYTPSRQNGEAVQLYEDAAIAGSHSGGVVVLPRLTLSYYFLLAGLLSLIGCISCIILRKHKNFFVLALKITLLPIMYAVSSVLVLGNKEQIYDAAYYFSGILLTTFILYIMGYWVIEFVRQHATARKA